MGPVGFDATHPAVVMRRLYPWVAHLLLLPLLRYAGEVAKHQLLLLLAGSPLPLCRLPLPLALEGSACCLAAAFLAAGPPKVTDCGARQVAAHCAHQQRVPALLPAQIAAAGNR